MSNTGTGTARDDFDNAREDTERAGNLDMLVEDTQNRMSPAEAARVAAKFREAAQFMRDTANTLDRGAQTIIDTLRDYGAIQSEKDAAHAAKLVHRDDAIAEDAGTIQGSSRGRIADTDPRNVGAR